MAGLYSDLYETEAYPAAQQVMANYLQGNAAANDGMVPLADLVQHMMQQPANIIEALMKIAVWQIIEFDGESPTRDWTIRSIDRNDERITVIATGAGQPIIG